MPKNAKIIFCLNNFDSTGTSVIMTSQSVKFDRNNNKTSNLILINLDKTEK